MRETRKGARHAVQRQSSRPEERFLGVWGLPSKTTMNMNPSPTRSCHLKRRPSRFKTRGTRNASSKPLVSRQPGLHNLPAAIKICYIEFSNVVHGPNCQEETQTKRNYADMYLERRNGSLKNRSIG